MRLSKSFLLSEFLVSGVARRNGLKLNPPKKDITSLMILCQRLLQPLRDKIRGPIRINSGWRSIELNKLLGGSYREKKNDDGSITKIYSQHCRGEAADIKYVDKNGRMDNKLLYDTIIDSGLEFDQMINEFNYSWIHISYSKDNNRNQILEAYKDEKGKTKYKVPDKYNSL